MPARPANPLFGRSRFGYKIAMVGFSLPTQLAICLFHRDKMSLGPIHLLFLWFRVCLIFLCANHHGRMDLAFLGGTLLNRLTPLPPPFLASLFFCVCIRGEFVHSSDFSKLQVSPGGHVVFFSCYLAVPVPSGWGTFFIPSDPIFQN